MGCRSLSTAHLLQISHLQRRSMQHMVRVWSWCRKVTACKPTRVTTHRWWLSQHLLWRRHHQRLTNLQQPLQGFELPPDLPPLPCRASGVGVDQVHATCSAAATMAELASGSTSCQGLVATARVPAGRHLPRNDTGMCWCDTRWVAQTGSCATKLDCTVPVPAWCFCATAWCSAHHGGLCCSSAFCSSNGCWARTTCKLHQYTNKPHLAAHIRGANAAGSPEHIATRSKAQHVAGPQQQCQSISHHDAAWPGRLQGCAGQLLSSFIHDAADRCHEATCVQARQETARWVLGWCCSRIMELHQGVVFLGCMLWQVHTCASTKCCSG